jgi:hypothetical protein
MIAKRFWIIRPSLSVIRYIRWRVSSWAGHLRSGQMPKAKCRFIKDLSGSHCVAA